MTEYESTASGAPAQFRNPKTVSSIPPAHHEITQKTHKDAQSAAQFIRIPGLTSPPGHAGTVATHGKTEKLPELSPRRPISMGSFSSAFSSASRRLGGIPSAPISPTAHSNEPKSQKNRQLSPPVPPKLASPRIMPNSAQPSVWPNSVTGPQPDPQQ
jgi:hypothetical protein